MYAHEGTKSKKFYCQRHYDEHFVKCKSVDCRETHSELFADSNLVFEEFVKHIDSNSTMTIADVAELFPGLCRIFVCCCDCRGVI